MRYAYVWLTRTLMYPFCSQVLHRVLSLKSCGVVIVRSLVNQQSCRVLFHPSKFVRRVVVYRLRCTCTTVVTNSEPCVVGHTATLPHPSLQQRILDSRNILANKTPVTMKLDSVHFLALFTPELKKLVDIFSRYNYELRIAGGAVRDLLLDKLPQDIDFATTATPTQMKEMFIKEETRMLNNKGESHGTITARIDDKENFEITTLRIDVVTDGRRAEVEFTTDWQLDASRRDLTVNSLFLGLDGTIYDFFEGIQDLQQRKVQFVGDAEKRIQEDYLRILRYFRFYGRIALDENNHNPETLNIIRKNASGLSGIAGERLWIELKKILSGRQNYHLLKLMIELGLPPFLGLPEQPNVAELDEMWARASSLHPQPITILAAIMSSVEEFVDFHERMRLSSYERDLGLFLLSHRGSTKSQEPLLHYQGLVFEGNTKTTTIVEFIQELLKCHGNGQLLEQFQSWEIPKFPVNGHMLTARGISGGWRFSSILNALKQRWVLSKFTLTEEEILSQLEEVQNEVNKQSSPPRPPKRSRKGSK